MCRLEEGGLAIRKFVQSVRHTGRRVTRKILYMTERTDVQLASVEMRDQHAVSLVTERNHDEIIQVLVRFHRQRIDYLRRLDEFLSLVPCGVVPETSKSSGYPSKQGW
jgi:hypothetical protein